MMILRKIMPLRRCWRPGLGDAEYAEGYPGRRYYQGNEIIDQIENLAQKRAQSLVFPR